MQTFLRCVQPSALTSPAKFSAASAFSLPDPVSVLRFRLSPYSTILPPTRRVQIAQLIPRIPAFRTNHTTILNPYLYYSSFGPL
jgi:hypothetical protein